MRTRQFRVSLDLNNSEYSKLISDTRKANLTKSAYLRKLIEKEEVKAQKPEEYFELLRLVSNIANNVNQIAHVANSNRYVSHDEIETAQKLVDMCWQHIKELE